MENAVSNHPNQDLQHISLRREKVDLQGLKTQSSFNY
jgi:hypothetical protein